VQKAVQDVRAHPRHTVKPDAPREPERPPRAHLAADLDGVGTPAVGVGTVAGGVGAAAGRPGPARRG
jgi:hypothetical protein